MKKVFAKYSFAALITLLFLSCSTLPEVAQHKGQDLFISKPQVKPEIIFIHGMFMTPKCWDNWISLFTKAGYKVSAPAWPLHEGTVENLREKSKLAELGKLTLSTVVDYYRQILKTKKEKPILIGHSMGGLIAQILFAEGLSSKVIAIDSAAPNGLIVLSWPFIKSNWAAVNPFANLDEPIEHDLDSFSYRFSSQQTAEIQKQVYDAQYVPESRRVPRESANEIGEIDVQKANGKLLLIAGSADHIIPAELNYKNFNLYENSPAQVDFKLFANRDHWIIGAPGWEEVANYSLSWLK